MAEGARKLTNNGTRKADSTKAAPLAPAQKSKNGLRGPGTAGGTAVASPESRGASPQTKPAQSAPAPVATDADGATVALGAAPPGMEQTPHPNTENSSSTNSTNRFLTHREAMQQGVFKVEKSHLEKSLGLLSLGEVIDGWGGEVASLISNSSSEAEVYLARKGGADYALKYYRIGISPKPEVVNALVKMNHPNLVRTYQLGIHGDSSYEVLQFAEGGPINKKNDDGSFAYLPFDLNRFEQLVEGMNEGLQYLHSQGLIHRDIKPGNILVGDYEKNEFMFADFGISSLLDLESGATERMTSVNRTEGYAAPEVYSGITRREVDYYALGITFYSLLTAKNPFLNMNPRHIMCFTVQGRVAEELLAREEAQKLPERVKRLIAGLLVVKNEERWRYQDVKRWLAGEDVAVYEGKHDNITEFQYDGGVTSDPVELAAACLSHAEDPAWHRFIKVQELSEWARKFDNVLAAQIKEVEVHYGGLAKPETALRNIAYILDPDIPFDSKKGNKAHNRRELYEVLQKERKQYLTVVQDINADLYLWLSSRLKNQSLIEWCREWVSEESDDNVIFDGVCQAILGFETFYLSSGITITSLRELKDHSLSEKDRRTLMELVQNEKSRLYTWARLTKQSSVDSEILWFWRTYLGQPDLDLFIDFVTQFAIIQYGGWQYKGQITYVGEAATPNGIGAGIHTDGRKYIGSWSNGLRHGKGTTDYPDGNIYTGYYEKDKEFGDGLLKAAGGRELKGKFLNGRLQGMGQLKDKSGTYRGNFVDGLRHGMGTFKYKRGDEYQGNWHADLRHGMGSMLFSTGETYSGTWNQGAMEGQGQLVNPKKGWTYRGFFKDSKREGMGVLESLGGSWERGIWKKNVLYHGQRVKREQYQLRYVYEVVNNGKSVYKIKVSGEKRLKVAMRRTVPGLFLIGVGLSCLVGTGIAAESLPISGIAALILFVLAFVFLPAAKHLVMSVRTLMGLAKDANGDQIFDWSARSTLAGKR